MTIEMFHLVMDIEFSMGDFDYLRYSIGQVLEHGRTVQDKGPAFVHSLGIIMQGKDRDHGLAIKKGIAILAWLGVNLSVDPDNVQSTDIEEAERRCSVALGPNRKVVDLLDCPSSIEDDSTVLCVMERMVKASIYSGRIQFAYILGQTAIQICAKQDGTNEFLPRIYMYTQMYFRKLGLNYMAYDCAVTCKQLVDKLSNVSIEGYCQVTVTCNNGMQLFKPVHNAVRVYEECYIKSLRMAGDTEFAFLIANSFGMSYFLSGMPITDDVTKIFTSFADECRRYNQPSSVYTIFQIYHQLILNLRGQSSHPINFHGPVIEEGTILSGFLVGTAPYKQTLRDLSSCKMMAAYIFRNDSVMEETINILQDYPDFDVLLHRLNMRILWQGLGAFALARNISSRRSRNEYLAIGKKYLNSYQEQSKQGNPNAKVAYLC